MPQHTPSKLFLADQRGVLETSDFRRFSTFAFGAYVHEYKQPFGSLHALNEETLAGRHTVSFPVTDAAYLLILPITGAVWAGTAAGVPALVDVAELRVLPVEAGSTVQFTNPYETELISFLHIWLKAPTKTLATAHIFVLDLDEQLNKLVAATPVLAGPPFERLNADKLFRVHMGRFAGRTEATCDLSEGTHFFAFVLAGAFEIEGRLVHVGDGLALWNTPAVELEALSNNAVVVTLELAA